MSMSKIEIYVENSFASLPRTQEVAEVKRNITESMEERYEALLKEGKNENEAFGAVISEFGSMDEIRQELGISEDPYSTDIPFSEGAVPAPVPTSIPEELLRGYEAFRNRFAIAITAGVVLCILAVVMLQIFEAIFGEGFLAMTIFFLLIAAGVSLFVYFGMQKSYWEEQLDSYRAPEANYTHHHAHKGKNDTLAGRLSGAIMLTATAMYLILGFLFDLWHPGWVVFPVGGILCGIVETLIGNKP